MIQQLYKRFIAPTPKYFFWLSNYCIGLATTCALGLNFWNTLGLGELPEFMRMTFHAIGCAGTIGFIISRLKVDQAAKQDPQEKKM